MKNFFSKKSHIICFFWTLIGIIILILISQFAGTSLQGVISNIVIFYVLGSWIISGVIYRIVKKERKKQKNLPPNN